MQGTVRDLNTKEQMEALREAATGHKRQAGMAIAEVPPALFRKSSDPVSTMAVPLHESKCKCKVPFTESRKRC